VPTTESATHKSLMELMSSLERLAAQRDVLEEEIERDLVLLKDRWGIDDIDSALSSIESIKKQALDAATKRDQAISSAEQIMALFKD
jgi:hypothetical protein